MKDERLVQEKFLSEAPLAVVEKYEDFLNYLYPIIIGLPRKHAVARDQIMQALFVPPPLFYEAAKAKLISKLYAADAALASLRFYLRFLVHRDRQLISLQQFRVASIQIAEVGKMLGAWINSHGGKKG